MKHASVRRVAFNSLPQPPANSVFATQQPGGRAHPQEKGDMAAAYARYRNDAQRLVEQAQCRAVLPALRPGPGMSFMRLVPRHCSRGPP